MNCGTDDKHEWQEVNALHSKMIIVYSGGLVYKYVQEGSNYGLVKINSEDLKDLSDIDALKSAFEKTTNPEGVAMVFDDGAVVVKMGREEPAVLMDGSGKIVWAKHNEVTSTVIKSGDASVKDGTPLALPMKDLGSCEVYPQTLSHCAGKGDGFTGSGSQSKGTSSTGTAEPGSASVDGSEQPPELGQTDPALMAARSCSGATSVAYRKASPEYPTVKMNSKTKRKTTAMTRAPVMLVTEVVPARMPLQTQKVHTPLRTLHLHTRNIIAVEKEQDNGTLTRHTILAVDACSMECMPIMLTSYSAGSFFSAEDGHAIDNDLNACRTIHSTVINTVLLYPAQKKVPPAAAPALASSVHNVDGHMLQGDIEVVCMDMMLQSKIHAPKALGELLSQQFHWNHAQSPHLTFPWLPTTLLASLEDAKGKHCDLTLRRQSPIFNLNRAYAILFFASLILGVFCSPWKIESHKRFCMARAPHPGDCEEICNGLMIDIEAIVDPFEPMTWEHGLCAFGVSNLEPTAVILPLQVLAGFCFQILIKNVSRTWCDEYIEGREPWLAMAITANEEDLPPYAANYTPSSPEPTLSPRNIVLALIWGSSLILL